eukprot:13671274-Alexandrium_andersonii.AAC.1
MPNLLSKEAGGRAGGAARGVSGGGAPPRRPIIAIYHCRYARVEGFPAEVAPWLALGASQARFWQSGAAASPHAE